MTISLPGYANPHFLGQQLAAAFPIMRGKTQVICTSPRRSGPMVTVMTNALVDGEAVRSFIVGLSRQAVADTQAIESVLTPDEQPKTRRKGRK